MSLNNKKIEMIHSFQLAVQRYKKSLRYVRGEKNVIQKIFHNLRIFGIGYVIYVLSRFRVPILFGSMQARLFLGREMSLPMNDVGSSVYVLYGILPHKSERRFTLWMIHNLKDTDVFFDVGAHLGYYIALAEYSISSGEVHSFEANKKLCRYLDSNFKESPHVYHSCIALADIVGTVEFYDASHVEDSSVSSRFNLTAKSGAMSLIHATTIDAYVASGKQPPTIIKLDIEGGEYDALQGSSNVLRKHTLQILMEVWEGDMGRKYSHDAVVFLQGLGYEAFVIMDDGFVLPTPIADSMVYLSSVPGEARDNFLFSMSS